MKQKSTYSLPSNLLYMFRHLWKHDRTYLFAFIPNIPIAVLVPFASDYYLALLVNSIIARVSDTRMLVIIGVYGALLLLINLISQACTARIDASRYVHRIIIGSMNNMKTYTTDYENAESPDFKDKMETAGNATDSIENTAGAVTSLLITLLGIGAYGTMLSLMSPVFAVMLVVYTVITSIITARGRKIVLAVQKDSANVGRELNYLSQLSQKYEQAKDIRLFSMKPWLLEMLDNSTANYFNAVTRKIQNNLTLSGLITILLNITRDGFAYVLLIGLLIAGKMDAGMFILYFAAVGRLSDWMSNLVSHISNITRFGTEIGRFREFLAIPEKFNYGEGPALPEVTPFGIELHNLSYKYPTGDKNAIDNVNLAIKPGEKIAIVGVNGAGKTTLAKLLCGMYYPTSGAITVNGRDVREYNINEYYTLFSAVFQDIILLPISIARFVSGNGEDVDRERVKQSLSKAGLWDVVEKLPNGMDNTLMKGIFDDGVDLSGGEKQKLMLARALYKNAPVIVLDEPTAALDPIAESELYQKYDDLTQEKTAFYISHRLASTRFCDRIIYIENGAIMENGSHEELMLLDGLYAKMFNVQSQYYKEGALSEEYTNT